MKRCVMAGVDLVAAICAGCGTVQNLTPANGEWAPLEVYGGVKRSVDTANIWSLSGSGAAEHSPLFAADVALSAVGDTITLPITGTAWVARYIMLVVAACRGEI
jgi:uncharacterized protein YceK